MSQPSAISGLQMWMRAPKAQSSRCFHLPWWLLRSWENTRSSHLAQLPLLKVNKEKGFGPDRWGTYENNEFREPRGLNLPTHPMLNCLIWYLIFDVQTACSLCCKFVCSLTPTPCSKGNTFLRATEMLSPGLGVLNFPPNKIKVSFQVVTIFFSWQYKISVLKGISVLENYSHHQACITTLCYTLKILLREYTSC